MLLLNHKREDDVLVHNVFYFPILHKTTEDMVYSVQFILYFNNKASIILGSSSTSLMFGTHNMILTAWFPFEDMGIQELHNSSLF